MTKRTKCIFYGGKGGVGKTTCAAATGIGLAADGRRTLVVSTDPAHSLSDSLGIDLGAEPRELERKSNTEVVTLPEREGEVQGLGSGRSIAERLPPDPPSGDR